MNKVENLKINNVNVKKIIMFEEQDKIERSDDVIVYAILAIEGVQEEESDDFYIAKNVRFKRRAEIFGEQLLQDWGNSAQTYLSRLICPDLSVQTYWIDPVFAKKILEIADIDKFRIIHKAFYASTYVEAEKDASAYIDSEINKLIKAVNIRNNLYKTAQTELRKKEKLDKITILREEVEKIEAEIRKIQIDLAE